MRTILLTFLHNLWCVYVYFPNGNYFGEMTHFKFFLITIKQIWTIKIADERQNNSGQCKE